MLDLEESLWGDEFDIPVTKKTKTKKVIEKVSNPKEIKNVIRKSVGKKVEVSLTDKLEEIKTNVLRVLGKQKDNVIIIKSKEEYFNYLKSCIKFGRVAVDTETNNSLDPITCKLMGLCLYYKGGKQAYIPVNHRNPETKERLDWQLTEADIKEGLDLLNVNQTFQVYHNGKFDYQVLKCTTGSEMKVNWDTLIGAKLLDENEFTAGLKPQYISKIDPEQEKYSIDHLFEGVEYADVDPDIFALYAATDSMMTDRLYEYQMTQFEYADNSKILNLARTVEMPFVTVNASLELAGMEVDQEYGARLSKKYHNKLIKLDEELTQILLDLDPQIKAWCHTQDAISAQKKKMTQKQYERAVSSKNFDSTLWTNILGVWYKVSKSKLEQLYGVIKPEDIKVSLTPEDLASPTKLAIILYDALQCPIVSKDKDKPRATGEQEMKDLFEATKLPICNLIIKRRELVKLLSTYIDNIPELAKRWPDGRVRTHFNQYGAATGRLSSSEPLNFQNIPSHNKEIRLLFKARDGYRIVGGDFSAQEPRLVAHYSQDENMIKAYLEGKDLYSVIASESFNVPYEDCLEFFPEGTSILFEGQQIITGYKTHQNKYGKERRTQAKAILLGILYGRGAASVGEQIGKTREEAQEIIDKFFKAFPKVQQWIEESKACCKINEYVEDIAGRRRRLPDINLPDYTVRYEKKKDETITAPADFNPLIGCSNRQNDSLIDDITKQIMACRSNKQKDEVKRRAQAQGIEIIANGGFKAEAERQCVNARVQGGAATLTKSALIHIYNDQRLKDIGAYLINTVHDEILLEVPEEYSELCESYLTEDMVESAKMWVPKVPMKCDAYNVSSWYMDEYQVTVESEFKKLTEGDSKKNIAGISQLEAFNKIVNERTEVTKEFLYNLLHASMTEVTYDQVFN